MSNHRQTRRVAREQQTWNRLSHARWASAAPEQPSWRLAVAVAALALVVFFGQFGG